MALPNSRWRCPTTGSSARLQAKNPYPQLKLHRLAAANDRLRVAEPRALCDARAGGDIDVNAVPDLNKATAMAATDQTKAARLRNNSSHAKRSLSAKSHVNRHFPEAGFYRYTDPHPALAIRSPGEIQRQSREYLTLACA